MVKRITYGCHFFSFFSFFLFLIIHDPVQSLSSYSSVSIFQFKCWYIKKKKKKKKKNRFLSFRRLYIKYAISIKLDLFSARAFYVCFTCCTSHSDKGDHQLNACYWKLKTFNYYSEWVANARLLIVNFNDNSPLFYSHNIAKNWWNKRNKYRKIY